jgi:hypothetical protein
MSVAFEIEPHEPQLEEEPEGASPEQPELDPAAVIAPGWSPEAAQQFLMTVWNLGCLFYGPEWAADPREFVGWNDAAANLLDMVLPYSVGGPAGLGLNVARVAGGVAMMVMRRGELRKRGPNWWKKPGLPQQPAGAPQPAQPAPAAAAPAPGEAPQGFKFAPEEAAIVDQAADHSYDGLGIQAA